MAQTQNNNVSNNTLISMFQIHGNQCLKFHFLPFLNVEQRTIARSTCQIIKNNIPTPQYSYCKTQFGDATARIEKNTGFVETRERGGGDLDHGGDSSRVSSDLQCDVKKVASTLASFAALKKNGRVITWGRPDYGGDSSGVSSDLQCDVKKVFSTFCSFAAVKKNGRVITWGRPDWGGDSSRVISDLQSGVKKIFSTGASFAALKANGQVITWGDPMYGGDSSNVNSDLQCDVKKIVSTLGSFAALKKNGQVITWGPSIYGGDSSNVSEFLQNGVIKIVVCGNGEKFRAIKYDGTVYTQVTWP